MSSELYVPLIDQDTTDKDEKDSFFDLKWGNYTWIRVFLVVFLIVSCLFIICFYVDPRHLALEHYLTGIIWYTVVVSVIMKYYFINHFETSGKQLNTNNGWYLLFILLHIFIGTGLFFANDSLFRYKLFYSYNLDKIILSHYSWGLVGWFTCIFDATIFNYSILNSIPFIEKYKYLQAFFWYIFTWFLWFLLFSIFFANNSWIWFAFLIAIFQCVIVATFLTQYQWSSFISSIGHSSDIVRGYRVLIFVLSFGLVFGLVLFTVIDSIFPFKQREEKWYLVADFSTFLLPPILFVRYYSKLEMPSCFKDSLIRFIFLLVCSILLFLFFHFTFDFAIIPYTFFKPITRDIPFNISLTFLLLHHQWLCSRIWMWTVQAEISLASSQKIKNKNENELSFLERLGIVKREIPPKFFSRSLAEIYESAKDDPGLLIDEVPSILVICSNFITKYGLDSVGIFRKSGNVAQVTELQNRFEAQDTVELDSSIDPHVVTSLLKKWFRELTDTLFTFDQYETWLSSIGRRGDLTKKDISNLKEVLKHQPDENQKVMKYLFQWLFEVSLSSNITKMNSQNLALVFVPNILRAQEESYEQVFSDSAGANAIVTTFVSNPSYFWPEFKKEQKSLLHRAPSEEPSLPSGWIEGFTGGGEHYYQNVYTKQVVWERPKKAAKPPEDQESDTPLLVSKPDDAKALPEYTKPIIITTKEVTEATKDKEKENQSTPTLSEDEKKEKKEIKEINPFSNVSNDNLEKNIQSNPFNDDTNVGDMPLKTSDRRDSWPDDSL